MKILIALSIFCIAASNAASPMKRTYKGIVKVKANPVESSLVYDDQMKNVSPRSNTIEGNTTTRMYDEVGPWMEMARKHSQATHHSGESENKYQTERKHRQKSYESGETVTHLRLRTAQHYKYDSAESEERDYSDRKKASNKYQRHKFHSAESEERYLPHRMKGLDRQKYDSVESEEKAAVPHLYTSKILESNENGVPLQIQSAEYASREESQEKVVPQQLESSGIRHPKFISENSEEKGEKQQHIVSREELEDKLSPHKESARIQQQEDREVPIQIESGEKFKQYTSREESKERPNVFQHSSFEDESEEISIPPWMETAAKHQQYIAQRLQLVIKSEPIELGTEVEQKADDISESDSFRPFAEPLRNTSQEDVPPQRKKQSIDLSPPEFKSARKQHHLKTDEKVEPYQMKTTRKHPQSERKSEISQHVDSEPLHMNATSKSFQKMIKPDERFQIKTAVKPQDSNEKTASLGSEERLQMMAEADSDDGTQYLQAGGRTPQEIYESLEPEELSEHLLKKHSTQMIAMKNEYQKTDKSQKIQTSRKHGEEKDETHHNSEKKHEKSHVENEVETVFPIKATEVEEKSARITGGKMAEAGQFPYQAGLLTRRGEHFSWCGGSLISDQWILTAAHCIDGVTKQVGVFLGTKNIKQLDNDTQIFWVKKKEDLIPHEDYYTNPTTIWNDIALIKLPEKTKMNDKVKPVKLAIRSDAEKTYVGEEIRSSGWGLTRDSDKAITDLLRFVDTPVLDLKNCSDYYRPGSILSTHVCMDTHDAKSVCSGDSGGPMLLKDTDIQIGLTSFGQKGKCEKGVPSVFTRISYYLDWIADKTGLDV
ncbi:hypothetical protein ACFFRR_003329 [Megaselia abdita]